MSNYAKGRGVLLDVATAFASPKTVTEVTEAAPPVATCAAHGLADKAVGYFSVATGMPALEGQACRVDNPATNTFELEDLDATSFGNYTAGTFLPVQTWSRLSNATEVNKTGGEGNPIDVSVLQDEIQQQEQGQLSPESVTINCRLETVSNAALDFIRTAARNQGYCLFRLTYKDGAARVFRGQPSLPNEQISVGQVGTASFTVTLKGVWIVGDV